MIPMFMVMMSNLFAYPPGEVNPGCMESEVKISWAIKEFD